MGRKGNFPLHQLPLHTVELPSRAGFEVRISVCTFPSSTPHCVSGPSQPCLWVSPSQGSQSELSSQTFASVKAEGRLGSARAERARRRAARTHTPVTPALTWGGVTCTCPILTCWATVCQPWSFLQRGHQSPCSYSRTKYPPSPSVKGSESKENHTRQRVNFLAHSFLHSKFLFHAYNVSASARTWG